MREYKEEDYPFFYERLNAIFKALDMNKRAIAKKIGMSHQNLNTIVYAKNNNPKLSFLRRLDATLNVNPLYFFDKEASMFKEEKVEPQTFETDREEQLYNEKEALKEEVEKLKLAIEALVKTKSKEK